MTDDGGKMKKRKKKVLICIGVLLLSAAAVVLLGWKAGKGPLGYLKYDTFHLGDKVYEVSEEEVVCYRDVNRIRGTLYLPKDEKDKRGIVILAHGLNGTAAANRTYARILARGGVAVYAFDFCGGSVEGTSDGDTLSMSVRTEMEDLESVIEEIESWDWVDSDNIVLMGESFGGLVCALTAAEREDINGLVLFYPAFSLEDNLKSMFSDPETVPETFSFMGMDLGKVFYDDAYELNAYEKIEAYSGNVLIVHGTKDTTVPFGYSKRACNHFQNAVLCEIRGADHGFIYDGALQALTETYDFVKEQMQ